EFVEGVERMRLQPRNGRVEPPARDHQQRKPGPGLLVMDADVALFIERHKWLLLLARFRPCEWTDRSPQTSGNPEAKRACYGRTLYRTLKRGMGGPSAWVRYEELARAIDSIQQSARLPKEMPGAARSCLVNSRAARHANKPVCF